MVEEPITAAERKYLLNRVNLGVFFALVLLVVPLVIGFNIQFDHLNSFSLFIIFKYLCIGMWLYFLCHLLRRAVTFYTYLLRGDVKKITAEFVVVKKDILKISNDDFSDTWHCYIFVHSSLAQQDLRLEIERSDHEQIQISDALTLTYYSHIDYLVTALYHNRKLEKASIMNKTKRRFFQK